MVKTRTYSHKGFICRLPSGIIRIRRMFLSSTLGLGRRKGRGKRLREVGRFSRRRAGDLERLVRYDRPS